MHSVLLACIQGRTGDAKAAMPLLVTKRAACVQRSLCLVDLLISSAASSAPLLRALMRNGAKASVCINTSCHCAAA